MKSAHLTKKTKNSLRYKLLLYMLVLAIIIINFFAVSMVVSDLIPNPKENIASSLDKQMQAFSRDMLSTGDSVTVMGIKMSEDMTQLVEHYLETNSLSLDTLKGNSKDINKLERLILEPLCQYINQTSCSGGFVILNSSVYTDNESSRLGLYIKKATPARIASSLSLFRGMSELAKNHSSENARVREISLHGKWQQEFSSNLFPHYHEALETVNEQGKTNCHLSGAVVLPGTSEKVMLTMLPLVNEHGTVYGLCGFEVSASWFISHHEQPSDMPRTAYVLISEPQTTSLDISKSIYSFSSNGSFFIPEDELEIQNLGSELIELSNGTLSFVGVDKYIDLTYYGHHQRLFVMIPKVDYNKAVFNHIFGNIVLFILLIFFAASCCVFFSNRFISPIIKSLEKIKTNQYDENAQEYELSEVFTHLATKQQEHEKTIDELKRKALSEQTRAAQLQDEAKQLEESIRQLQEKHSEVTEEITRLAYDRKSEIDPADLEFFTEGLKSLTPKEAELFNHYINGLSIKQAAAEMNVAESTVYYYNKSIYKTLGVHSIKELLRFVAVINRDDEQK